MSAAFSARWRPEVCDEAAHTASLVPKRRRLLVKAWLCSVGSVMVTYCRPAYLRSARRRVARAAPTLTIYNTLAKPAVMAA